MTTPVVGVLSLGTRADAGSWRRGCEALGMRAVAPVRKARPKLAELKAFFLTEPLWIYFGGHFYGSNLTNDCELNDEEDCAVKVAFNDEGAKLRALKRYATLTRDARTFRVHERCRVMLWGGCNVCTDEDTLRMLMNLFNRPLLLGFAGTTTAGIVNAVLAPGREPAQRFFGRIADMNDLVQVRDAWLAAALHVYGQKPIAARFRAIDPDGQEWRLSKGAIITGRKITL